MVHGNHAPFPADVATQFTPITVIRLPGSAEQVA
jgi:hypothetical protein